MSRKRILMIAYHFPPLAGSSGIQRTLRLVQQLPEFGWEPLVLGADPRAFENTSDDLMADVPAGIVVRRAFALDTARHLALGGRYMGWTARPDRWVSWRFDAVRTGMRMIREFAPHVIWSTYPIATAHMIGAELQRRSGLPWVADFRDPMAQDGYPADPMVWRSFRRIEEQAAHRAKLCVFTTPGAARIYRARYPQWSSRMVVLENGFDEESFPSTSGSALPSVRPTGAPVVLLHSGVVYPSERDPSQLFAALRALCDAGVLRPGALRLRFRAAVHDDFLRSMAMQHGVVEFVEMCPPIPYRQALAEMLAVDGLLVLQAANCNEQIPAKIYEYLRAGQPILGLTDPAGDTAQVLSNAGLDAIARLDSAEEIAATLSQFVASIQAQHPQLPDPGFVAGASRRARARQMGTLLDNIAG